MACVTNRPHRHKIGVNSGTSFPVDYRMAPVSVNHVWTPQHAQEEGMRGVPFEASEGVVYDKGSGSGPVQIEPRPDDFREILPYLLLGTFSTNTIVPAGVCTEFIFEHDAWVQRHRFTGCVTNTWSLTSSSRAPVLKLDWNFESKTFAAVSTAFPDLDLSILQPFVHKQAVVTIDGTEYPVDDVNISGNNSLDTGIFYNSATRTDIPPGMQLFTFTHSSPFDDSDGTDLIALGLSAEAVAASIVYTSGAYSLTINFPALQSPVKTPIMPAGNAVVRHQGIQWNARSVWDGVGGVVDPPIEIVLDDAA